MIKFPESLGYTHLMTPIESIGVRGEYKLWLKRDDLTGIELSGNKIRKLDYLAMDAVKQGAHGLMTCGGLQSNHCRATAFLGAKLGMKTILYLRGSAEVNPTGNYFLNLLAGARINFVTPEEYKEIDDIMQKKSEELKANGQNIYVIPEGGSNETGAWGYCQCFTEITEQLSKYEIPIDVIAVATGSGGTHAGLLIGKYLSNSPIDIISINVCDDALFFKNKILNIIENFADKNNLKLPCNKEDIHIHDGYVGDGYGLIGKAEIDMIKRFAREKGIVLDPVYTAKAYLGLESLMSKNILPYKNILFIHTGGIFGIFPLSANFI